MLGLHQPDYFLSFTLGLLHNYVKLTLSLSFQLYLVAQ